MKLKSILLLGFLPASLSAQICGRVTDASTHTPIPHAIVRLDSTLLVTTTALDGSFCLQTNRNGTLRIQMLGFDTKTLTVKSPASDVTIELQSTAYLGDEIIVNATRAEERSAIAHTTLDKAELEKQNFGQDVPFLLASQPSSVATSDGGTGIGYTGIRIRGTDANRINVTINGAPINDAESQGMYWVDLPDIASSAENIQVQRGVGTSTNGAGAFGGSINLQTNTFSEKPFSSLTVSGGSFNTRRITASAGTGLINNHWAFDGRLSRITSDGYIDRASADLLSWSFGGGWQGENIFVKALAFSGKEITYQAWDGVLEDSIKAGNYTYNQLGEYYDSLGRVNYYKNEVDNYKQDNYQLLFGWRVNTHWSVNATAHATLGKGYYEQYKAGENLDDYGLSNIAIGNTTITSTDLIRRKWLDNSFYGIVGSAQYRNFKRLDVTIGLGANQYLGRHFGEVIWAQYLPAGVLNDYVYYDNDATKNDANVFVRADYRLNTKFNFFGDLQVRSVMYSFLGIDDLGNALRQEANLFFVNPKAGLTYFWNDQTEAYAYFGVANKEPSRDDYTESGKMDRPLPETLYDSELGLRVRKTKTMFGVNVYYMNYKNQLVLTGKINNVGAYTRENIDKSYRAGVELEFKWNIIKPLRFMATTTFSQNKIQQYTEYLDDYDNGGQVAKVYTNTDLAFSPALTGFASLEYQLFKGFSITASERYVGKQFLDNTSSDKRSIAAYALTDLRLAYSFSAKKLKSCSIGLQINNLTNARYVANGYTFGYIYGGEQHYNYYFPQAGINALAMLQVKF